jgi:DNA-binding beta-propeller fold protein YncE
MSQSPSTLRPQTARACLILALLLGVGLLSAAPAAANYEQVDTFEEPAGLEILKRTGLAVNVNGAGGVSPGTLYEVGRAEAGGVNRYDAKGEFQSHWGGFASFGVAVGQSTGCVYAFKPGESKVVTVFSATGAEITTFGEKAPPGETLAESPQKLHESGEAAGIAVDAAGKVYVFDGIKLSESRIMVFEPGAPGSCEGYTYAGQANDIASGLYPAHPVLDGKGNLYVVVNGGLGIREFSLSAPSTPTCKFDLAAGGIVGLAVNPTTGELFYTSEKDKKRQIHVLKPCSEGKFEEDKAAAFTPEPAPEETVEALAFNPTLTWEPSRPMGVLYGASRSFFEDEPNYIFAGPVSHEPEVEAESVSNVTSSTATLKAQINPKGATTSYVFQYLSEAAYEANEPADRFAGASEAPLGGALLGGGKDPLPAAAAISGLAPDTAYRYRVLATSPEGADEGEAQLFHTYPDEAPGLPDDRAYELVSPPQKQGGEVFPANPFVSSCGAVECKPGTIAIRMPLQSAPDGNGVVYEGFPFSATEGAPRINEYLSKRTASGWQTTNPTPPLYLGDEGAGYGYKAFDDELTSGLFYGSHEVSFSPQAPPGYVNLFQQPTGNPTALSPFLTSPPPNRPKGPPAPAHLGLYLEYAGATGDLSHVLFAANDALTEATPLAPASEDGGPLKDNLYERVGGQLRLVNVLPGNAETVPGAVFGSGFKLSEESSTGTESNFFGLDFSHAISDDGSHVFWSSESGQVYVRIDGEETVEVKDAGRFLTASADGSRVLLGDGCLYDLETEACENLTGGLGGFEGIIGQSEDLSSIYFVDTAALTPESKENANGEHAEASKKNLYSWQEGSLAFIATLDSKDRTDWTVAPIKRTAEASPNGRWVAFLSRARLTGAENTGPCVFSSESEKIIPGPCPEAFLFDSASGELICASCDPSGELPLGPTFLPKIGVSDLSSLSQPRYLTDQGRLLFDTRDSLSLADTNNGVEDVYEYEPSGVGDCKREGGCISLISAGNEPVDSNFLAMDPSGANVFFTTRDQLTPKDRDDLIDLYDAREFGGIAAETETTRPECQGEACQPAPNPPNDLTPASSSFQGAGNVVQGKKAKKHAKKHKRKRHAKKRAHKAAHKRGGVR